MKTIKVKFNVGTEKVGSDVEETIEMQFDEDSTQEEIDNEINEVGRDWVFENIQWDYKIVEDNK